MKYIFLLFILATAAVSCNNSDQNTADPAAAKATTDTNSYTSVQWIDSLKDIGNVTMGQTVSINFKFKNTGEHPLFVINAEPGCGCTVTDYPKNAIAPGGEGVITAAFDSNKGHEGEFRKNINVTTNTKGSTSKVLYFMGVIVPASGADTGREKAKSTIIEPVRPVRKHKIS
jgi:hypothetical protein